MWKPALRLLKDILTGLLVALAACAIALILVIVWWRPWNPLWDEGPFRGVPRPIPTHPPQQDFPIWGTLRLQVYARTDASLAPVVVLRDAGGKILWSIEAQGRDGCQVNWLHFTRYSTAWVWPRVVGTVDWNCGGREYMVWKLGRDGSLKEYWYSW